MTAAKNNNNDGTTDDSTPSQQTIKAEMDSKYGARSGAYGMQPRKPHSYDHLHAQVGELKNRTQDPIDTTVFTQYHVNKGLKKFKVPRAEAVIKELEQLHNMDCLNPKKISELTEEDRKNVLQYLMFLKQKRCGTMKGCRCVDGRKQCEYLGKECVGPGKKERTMDRRGGW